MISMSLSDSVRRDNTMRPRIDPTQAEVEERERHVG
jgi:hypothetical protein